MTTLMFGEIIGTPHVLTAPNKRDVKEIHALSAIDDKVYTVTGVFHHRDNASFAFREIPTPIFDDRLNLTPSLPADVFNLSYTDGRGRTIRSLYKREGSQDVDDSVSFPTDEPFRLNKSYAAKLEDARILFLLPERYPDEATSSVKPESRQGRIDPGDESLEDRQWLE